MSAGAARAGVYDMFRSLALLPLLGMACSTGGEPSVAEDPIVGGRLAHGDPGVIAITRGGIRHCTGTVVSDRMVLTAAHCLRSWDYRELEALFFSNTVHAHSRDARVIRFSRAFVHERYPADANYDLALLELAEAAPVTPVPILRTELSPNVVGGSVRVVGFGKSEPSDTLAGVKREASARILELHDRRLVHEPNTCPGDSGGPGFMTIGGREVVVGVHSTGSCGLGPPSTKIRVDKNLDFILPMLDLAPNAEPPPVVEPQTQPPPNLPTRLNVTLDAARGTTLRHALRCVPGKDTLAITLGRGLHAYLRFEEPATRTHFDLDVPGEASLVTESDGVPFPAGTWHVLTEVRADVHGARLSVDCL